jgi:NADH:ubiquinone oxidoreductase subunit
MNPGQFACFSARLRRQALPISGVDRRARHNTARSRGLDVGDGRCHIVAVPARGSDAAKRARDNRKRIPRVITIGTIVSSLFFADLVGTDEFGNRYYRSRRDRRYGRERRWVIYKGTDEASKVPSEWHAWLHHTVAEPLTEKAALARSWQKPHQANPTGTADAHLPAGHEFRARRHAPATGDYEAWSPEDSPSGQ